MADAIGRDVSLDPGNDAFIGSQLEKGAYRSADAVIRAGLDALSDQEAETDVWLRERVAPRL